MYIIYSIHCESFCLSILNAYSSFKDSLEHLRSDVIDFLTNYKGIQNTILVNKKSEIRSAKTDGYFLKTSNKYPNRISLYQRTSKDTGYIMSNVEIVVKKMMVFSAIEYSSSTSQIELGLRNFVSIPLKNIPKVPYMEDLVKLLQERRKTIEGKTD